jgi:hypothetical protein
LGEGQECTELLSRQRVATLNSLKYKISLDVTIFWLLRDSICVIS